MLSAVSTSVLLAVPAILLAAYAAGRHAGRRETVPWRPIFQLVDHRVRCLGHDRARVRYELETVLPVPPWAWPELFAMRRPLDRRPLRAQQVRSAS